MNSFFKKINKLNKLNKLKVKGSLTDKVKYQMNIFYFK